MPKNLNIILRMIIGVLSFGTCIQLQAGDSEADFRKSFDKAYRFLELPKFDGSIHRIAKDLWKEDIRHVGIQRIRYEGVVDSSCQAEVTVLFHSKTDVTTTQPSQSSLKLEPDVLIFSVQTGQAGEYEVRSRIFATRTFNTPEYINLSENRSLDRKFGMRIPKGKNTSLQIIETFWGAPNQPKGSNGWLGGFGPLFVDYFKMKLTGGYAATHKMGVAMIRDEKGQLHLSIWNEAGGTEEWNDSDDPKTESLPKVLKCLSLKQTSFEQQFSREDFLKDVVPKLPFYITPLIDE